MTLRSRKATLSYIQTKSDPMIPIPNPILSYPIWTLANGNEFHLKLSYPILCRRTHSSFRQPALLGLSLLWRLVSWWSRVQIFTAGNLLNLLGSSLTISLHVLKIEVHQYPTWWQEGATNLTESTLSSVLQPVVWHSVHRTAPCVCRCLSV